jgi:hypothetical protein
MVIAKPHVLHLPKIRPNLRLSRAAARALNAFLANEAAAAAVGTALMYSIERAQGAAIANNGSWTHRQLVAAEGYAPDLADHLRRSVALRRHAVHALRQSHFPNIRITASIVSKVRRLLAHGVPRRLLRRSYLTRQEAQVLRSAILSERPSSEVGTFFDELAGRSTVSAIRAWAAALAAYAQQLHAAPFG